MNVAAYGAFMVVGDFLQRWRSDGGEGNDGIVAFGLESGIVVAGG